MTRPQQCCQSITSFSPSNENALGSVISKVKVSAKNTFGNRVLSRPTWNRLRLATAVWWVCLWRMEWLKQKQKREVVPLPPCRRQGGEKYSSYSFLTSALDGGEWSASRPGRALPLGKDLRYPLDRRLGGPQSWSGHTH